jgi:hypothetical protein
MKVLIAILFALGVLFVSVALGAERLSIRITPSVLFAGRPLTITCAIPENDANREIEAGITAGDDIVQRSFRQLDGASSRPTQQFPSFRSTCDTDAAYCRVHYNNQPPSLTRLPFQVAGCN